jgi:simple sugar transport system ATP-binding protein
MLGAHRRSPYSDGLFLNWKEIFRRARELIQQFNIKTQGPAEAASNLSGGNIQRLMLARAFSNSPTFLIAHNPSQGLDIPSIEFLYSLLLERKKQGMATLLISEDADELFLLCQRIAVIYRGRIAGVLAREQFDKYELGRLMSGANSDE